MRTVLMILCLLGQNRAGPLGEPGRLPLQLDQNTEQRPVFIFNETDAPLPSKAPDVPQQAASSSSSSSSSSASSESDQSQSSESPEQLTEQQNPDNTAVEQMDPQEPPGNSSSLWNTELVPLGEKAGESDGENHIGDDGEEPTDNRLRMLLLTYQHLLTGRRRDMNPALEAAVVGGANDGEVGVADREEGLKEESDAFSSTGRAEGPAYGLLDHAHHPGYHGDETGLELRL